MILPIIALLAASSCGVDDDCEVSTEEPQDLPRVSLIGPNVKQSCFRDGQPAIAPSPEGEGGDSGTRGIVVVGGGSREWDSEHARDELRRCWVSWMWYYEQIMPAVDEAERRYDLLAEGVRKYLGIDAQPLTMRDRGRGSRGTSGSLE
eukprot:Hpha_TRINITY_DN23026_c0_g1::TRINITY_DN23026_c0_g1_i1::g.109437::m.109437